MIKIILTSIIIFIIILLVLLTLNIKIEYFNNVFISNRYPILKDNNDIIQPYLWYKFENNLNDSSVNNKTLVNRSGFSPVSFNNNIVIRGTHSAFFNQNSCLQNTDISLSLPFTVSFWMNTNYYSPIPPGGYTILSFLNNTLPIYNIDLDSYTNGSRSYRILSAIAINAQWSFFTSDWLNYNTWYHFCSVIQVVNGVAQLKLYINGNLVNTINGISNNIRANPNSIYVGVNADGFLRKYKGYLNDLRVYRGNALNDEQVFELYTGYKQVGEVIDTSTNCVANMNSSGIIKQVPDTNFEITNISDINRLNDYIFNQSFNNAGITYTLTFSRYLDNNYSPVNLLLRNNKSSIFYDSINRDNYDQNGNYIGIFSKNINIQPPILSNYTQKGDFIHIRLTSSNSTYPIKLKRYGFKVDPQRPSRAPGTWALYTGTRLLEPSTTNAKLLVNNTTRLNNNSYCSANQYTYFHDIGANETSANELLFIFTSLADFGNNNSDGVLSFINLLLFTS